MSAPRAAEQWQAEMVAEHAEAGYTVGEIAVLVFGSDHPKTHRLVERTLQAADEYIDEIAMTRAAQGDRAVWHALTPHERAEFVRRTERRFLAEEQAACQPHTGRGNRLESRWTLHVALGISNSHWRAMVQRYLDE